MSDRVLSPKQQNRLNSISGFTTNLTPASVFEENLSYSAAADPVAASTGNIQPVLNIGTPNRYNPDGTAQVIAPRLSIVDPDGGTLDAANVFISGNFTTTESLGISGQTGSSGTIGALSWTYNPTTGVLSFSGTANNLEYESALKSVTYTNTNAQEGQGRGIEFSLGRPIYFAPNGHYYEFVNNRGISWTNAKNAADGSDYFGLQGYLATITSQAEQDFIQQRLAGNGWIGANDIETPDTWRWVTGPEAGTIFWSGGPKGQGGQPVDGRYENWRTLNDPEPNNTGGNESYAHMIGNDDIDQGQSRGKWNDLPDKRDYGSIPQFEPLGYVVEYGGFANETQPQTRGLANLLFSADVDNPLSFPDFNEDGTPDILWRNYNDGKNAIWTIKYNAANSTTPFTLGPDSKFITEVEDTGWSVEGVADYDNDGVLDIFWRNYNDGKNAIWLMRNGSNGLELKNGYFITEVPDTAWEIEAAKDFNGDSKQNILWRNYSTGQNAIWTLDFNAANTNNPFSLNSAGTVFIDEQTDPNWEIAGWHDMTGDGIADIVWHNFSTGRNAVWGLRSTNGVPSVDNTKQYFVSDAPVGWELEEVVDFNDDGIGDFLWRNYATGENAIWEMSSGGDIKPNGNYFLTSTGTPAADWEIEGVADFTGDGIGDILWRNYATDDTAIWRMRRNQNGRIELDGGFVLSQKTDDTNWEIEAPSPGNRILERA